MSRTDKTRPYRVIQDDPYYEQFKMIGNVGYPMDGTSEHYWKRVTSCHDSNCCGKNSPWTCKESSRRRHGWKRELRKMLVD